MAHEPFVVIVVVTWNGLRDTLHCLTSLRNIRYSAYRVVVVDNASADGTPETVQRYFPEVYLIPNPSNAGYVRANNQGIAWALAQGADWVLLLNNDVYMEPDALAELIRVGETSPNTGIVGPVMQRTLRPDLLDLGGNLDFRWGRVFLRQVQPSLNGRGIEPVDYVWGCALMARRNILEQTGGLASIYTAYFEDAELCLRARQMGWQTVAVLDARVVHQVGKSGEKRFVWQTYLRMRNHALFFLRMSRPRHWLTLIPSLFAVQLPLIFARSVRVYLARKLRRRKYAARPITLWGYSDHVECPTTEQIEGWLRDVGYDHL